SRPFCSRSWNPFLPLGLCPQLGRRANHGHFDAIRGGTDRPSSAWWSVPRSAAADSTAKQGELREEPSETRCLVMQRSSITSERLLSPPSRRYVSCGPENPPAALDRQRGLTDCAYYPKLWHSVQIGTLRQTCH